MLQDLIQEALAGNYDLQIAAARVQQARAQVGVARAAFFPQIGYHGDGRSVATPSRRFSGSLPTSRYTRT